MTDLKSKIQKAAVLNRAAINEKNLETMPQHKNTDDLFEAGCEYQHAQTQWQRDALKIAVKTLEPFSGKDGYEEVNLALVKIAALVPGGEK
jgi:hypothetical protein